MPVLAIGIDHITEMIVVDAIMLRTDERNVIAANEERAAAIDFALKQIVIDAVFPAAGTIHSHPMLPVPRLGPLDWAKDVSRHANVMAVFKQHGLLIGVILKDKAFENDVLTIFEDEPGSASDHRFAAMLRPKNNGLFLRALFPHNFGPAFGIVGTI